MAPRTVLITGASSGIGRALAVELSTRGAHVAVAARRKDELDALAHEIEGKGGRALALPVDICDTDAAMETVRKADRDLGALDMVIANAGIGYFGHASTTSWGDITRIIDVNIRGAMATLHAAIPIFLAQKGGHLVGVTSLAASRGLPYAAPYSASKAALSNYLESLRIDLHAAGIRVTEVQPGFVDTAMLQKQAHPTPFLWSQERAARYIVRRLASAPAIVAFPWPLALLTRLSRLLPAWVYDPLTRALAAR